MRPKPLMPIFRVMSEASFGERGSAAGGLAGRRRGFAQRRVAAAAVFGEVAHQPAHRFEIGAVADVPALGFGPDQAGLLQGLAEGLAFAQRAKLDVEKVIGVISKGAAQSWQMENRWKAMNEVKFDGFGFAVEWMRKDLGIALEEAKKNGSRLPVTALIDQFYAHVQARGGTRWDTCSLMHLLAKD